MSKRRWCVHCRGFSIEPLVWIGEEKMCVGCGARKISDYLKLADQVRELEHQGKEGKTHDHTQDRDASGTNAHR
jgi:hypothetical protein